AVIAIDATDSANRVSHCRRLTGWSSTRADSGRGERGRLPESGLRLRFTIPSGDASRFMRPLYRHGRVPATPEMERVGGFRLGYDDPAQGQQLAGEAPPPALDAGV